MNEKLKKFERYLLEELKRYHENHHKKDEMAPFYTGSISTATNFLNRFYELFAEEINEYDA